MSRASLGDLRPGTYVISVHPVVMKRKHGAIDRRARAYPARTRLRVVVRAGHRAEVTVSYRGIINPRVRSMPAEALGLRGDPTNPKAVIFAGHTSPPTKGTILTSAATSALPYGLMSTVTDTQTEADKLVVDVQAAPIEDAAPSINFDGSLPLALAPGGIGDSGDAADLQQRRATVRSVSAAADACHLKNVLKFGASLNSVELRQASVGVFPPQMRLTLAVRSTETMGLNVGAGVKCDVALGELGTYRGVIAVGPVPIPVYATVPISASVQISGKMSPGAINVASTTVASVAAGADAGARLTQEGTNVWLSGSPGISGSAKLSATISLQAGVGLPGGVNAHVAAGFGPVFSWSSGQRCSLVLNLGSLSAGVHIIGRDINAPVWPGMNIPVWSGCDPSRTADAPGSAQTTAASSEPDTGPDVSNNSGGGGGGGGNSGGSPAPAPGVGTRLLGDVDGDGRADAVVMFKDSGTAMVAGALPGGGFGIPTKWSYGHSVNADRYFLGDVNGDGRADLVAEYAASGDWNVSLSSGSGFWPPTAWAHGHGVGTSRQWIADATGDGKADLVTFDAGSGDWYLSASDGNGFQTFQRWISGHGVGSSDQAVGDVNGDGRADAAVWTAGDGAWHVALSSGTLFGYPGQWSFGHGQGTDKRYLADTNGDGKADEVFFHASDGRWYDGDSDGSGFYAPTAWAIGHGVGTTDQLLGDVTGDHKADLVTFDRGTGDWYVSVSDGHGFQTFQRWATGHGAGS